MKNIQLESLIKNLKKKSIDEKVAIWKRVASDLEKSNRGRRIVNLGNLNRHVKQGEIVVVPGKVLGDGELDKQVTIAAYQFSSSAIEKIKSGKSSAIMIDELMKKNPKGQKVRVMG